MGVLNIQLWCAEQTAWVCWTYSMGVLNSLQSGLNLLPEAAECRRLEWSQLVRVTNTYRTAGYIGTNIALQKEPSGFRILHWMLVVPPIPWEDINVWHFHSSPIAESWLRLEDLQTFLQWKRIPPASNRWQQDWLGTWGLARRSTAIMPNTGSHDGNELSRYQF